VCNKEWYSAFYDNIGFNQTELNGYLGMNGIQSVVVTGIALDTVVYYTALDAISLGYRVFVFVPSGLQFSSGPLSNLVSKGVKIINTLAQLQTSIQLDNSAFFSQAVSFNVGGSNLKSWATASFHCSPNRLCNSTEICPYTTFLMNGAVPPNTWVPAGDFYQAWVSLDNCTLNPNNPAIIVWPDGVPYMCCYSPIPTPQPVIPQVPVTPVSTPVMAAQPYDENQDSTEQVTRIALIACLCFGASFIIGGLGGYYLTKKGIIRSPSLHSAPIRE